MNLTVVALLVGVNVGMGQWAEIPQQQQTTGWSDCEARAHDINIAASPMLLAYCREIKVTEQ